MPTLQEALAAVPQHYRGQVKWSARANKRDWHARVGPFSTVGMPGAPYRTAGEAVMAAVRMALEAARDGAPPTPGPDHS